MLPLFPVFSSFSLLALVIGICWAEISMSIDEPWPVIHERRHPWPNPFA
jgi:hypothetical protein